MKNKNHALEVNGQTFFTAQVVDAYEKKTYDMTVIFLDPGEEYSPIIIDYYYGEPSEPLTKSYIERYFETIRKDADNDEGNS